MTWKELEDHSPELIRMLLRYRRVFGTPAQPIYVQTKREAVRLRLAHRIEKRVLQRMYRLVMGHSMFAVRRSYRRWTRQYSGGAPEKRRHDSRAKLR